MTSAQADALIKTLPKPGGLKLFREGDTIVMSGGKMGSHSIHVPVSSAERLLAHWQGYIENQGLSLGPGYTSTRPASSTEFHAGQWVLFPSKSSKTGWRRGQIVRVTPKRVLIAFRFNRERLQDQKMGLPFDPENARTTWRTRAEIKRP